MTETTKITVFTVFCVLLGSATSNRSPKALPYFDYLNPEAYFEMATEDQNEISRTIPRRKPIQYNSPIYYIKLPPQPYVYVPGLGYISQPPPQPVSPLSELVNLPLSFVANGKPSTIYQWTGGDSLGFNPKPTKRPDSTVHKLQGQFQFNGKPDNMFVLRDSYNALYGDALQNFYP